MHTVNLNRMSPHRAKLDRNLDHFVSSLLTYLFSCRIDRIDKAQTCAFSNFLHISRVGYLVENACIVVSVPLLLYLSPICQPMDRRRRVSISLLSLDKILPSASSLSNILRSLPLDPSNYIYTLGYAPFIRCRLPRSHFLPSSLS